MIKLSSLKDDEMLLFEGDSKIISVEGIRKDLNYYKEKIKHQKLYRTTKIIASLNADDILDSAIENECDTMYEDWDDLIREDIKQEDIDEIQKVLDRILARNVSQNIAYIPFEEVEIDL